MSSFSGLPRHVDGTAVGGDAVRRLDDDRIARIKLKDCEAKPVAKRERVDGERRRRSLERERGAALHRDVLSESDVCSLGENELALIDARPGMVAANVAIDVQSVCLKHVRLEGTGSGLHEEAFGFIIRPLALVLELGVDGDVVVCKRVEREAIGAEAKFRHGIYGGVSVCPRLNCAAVEECRRPCTALLARNALAPTTQGIETRTPAKKLEFAHRRRVTQIHVRADVGLSARLAEHGAPLFAAVSIVMSNANHAADVERSAFEEVHRIAPVSTADVESFA